MAPSPSNRKLDISRRLPVGVEVVNHIQSADRMVHARVWAPACKSVDLVVEGGETFALEQEPNGYFAGLAKGVTTGTRYRFRLDGGDALPDPASRLLTWVWPRWIPLDNKARAVERFEWLEKELSRSKLPTLIVWGRQDEVFDAATFSHRFKQMMPHAEGPLLVTGRHFLQEDSGPEIADLIRLFLDRLDRGEGAR